MLSSIHIKDFAIIEQLDLDLQSGMTVVTGETGAGKSIMVDALSFALGARADSAVVRNGAKRAEISAVFDIKKLKPVQAWLDEQMLDDEDDCILRRVINHDGRSRAFINGQPVNLTQLSELGDFLVDIHGQHEHQSLFKPQTHLQLLDRFADLSAETQELRTLSKQISSISTKLTSFKESLKDKNDRRDLLTFQLEELEKAPIDRAHDIENDHKRAANASKLLEQGQQSLMALNEDDENIVSQLGRIIHIINDMQQMDQGVTGTHDLLQSALVEIEEASHELRDYIEHLDIDPAEFQQLDQELTLLHDLARKHQVTMVDLPETKQAIEQELEQLSGDEQTFDDLEKELALQQDSYQKLATKVSKARAKSAKDLEKQVVKLMKDLGLGNGVFEVALNPTDTDSYKSQGLETAEFMVSTNPGQQPQPLRKVASGGELSRISLALQVINAQTIQLPTLIFDEVDVGIGGGTAEIVGKLLADLGKKAQILCVTHQAQVAAQGHQHLMVAKSQDKKSTQTELQELNTDQRVEELARMIGGVEITETIRNHARELLKE
ncbi:DNA repair protein RecN [Kangiella geojedonensis]|uniref:DNA repair protein RecN n=1 Tax=Kangiella geojedonensis TaxID=914150 RepID=A0A0F6RBI5_9GAMM|nr:DNA repair protein RecN [Kangiella geojedonensis]AKE51176.1 DNA repair protein RecN [Kangiella geojedonensis]